MQSADEAPLSTWLICDGAETLNAALPDTGRTHLAGSLDLPPQFGGVGLQSLIRVYDEVFLGRGHISLPTSSPFADPRVYRSILRLRTPSTRW